MSRLPIGWIIGGAILGAICAELTYRVAFGAGYDRLVQIIETRQGISPGQTRVLTDCGCTIRYVGTTVHGRRYTVVIDRLD